MEKSIQPNSQPTGAWRTRGFALRAVLRGSLGSSVLELALVMPAFALLVVMATEAGRMAYYGIEVSNAASAGVAYGAQSASTSTNNAAIRTAASNDAPNLTSIATLTVTPTLACQCANGTTFTTVSCATAGATCLSPSRVIKYVQVNTSAPVNSMFRYPGLPTSYTLLGQAVMRIE